MAGDERAGPSIPRRCGDRVAGPVWDTDKQASPVAPTGTRGAAGTAQCTVAGCGLAPTPVRHRAAAGAPRPGRPQAKLPKFPQTREASGKRKSKVRLGCICSRRHNEQLCSHPAPRRPESCSALTCLPGRRARTPRPSLWQPRQTGHMNGPRESSPRGCRAQGGRTFPWGHPRGRGPQLPGETLPQGPQAPDCS